MECLKKYGFYILLALVGIILLVRSCEPKPSVKVETKVNLTKIMDSVRSATLEGFKPVYIDTSKTDIRYVKGKTIYKDSIVYVDAPNGNTIKANQYDVQLKGDGTTSKLKITTTGQLIDVTGTIDYTAKETTTTVTKTVPMSGLFIYGGASVVPMLQSAEIGIDYQIKNAVIIGVNASHNFKYNFNSIGVKLGVRIF